MKTNTCTVLPAEMNVAKEWVLAHLGNTETPHFSFIYGGQSSKELLSSWKRKETSKELDNQRTQHIVTYTDPSTRLQIRCVAVVYKDFPVVEWTVYLKNAGKRNTPIIEQLQGLDAPVERGLFGQAGDAPAVRLNYHVGSPTKAEDYQPLTAELKPGDVKAVATSGGRACNAHMPFFNLEWPDGGVILAIGWGGQWATEFRHGDRGVNIKAGQELTHFTLHPGEEVRTPLIALLFYQGDRIRSQNIWRRWMIAHNLPRPNGNLPAPMLCGVYFIHFAPWGISNAQTIKVLIDTFEARKLPIDAWWIDAGWYNCDASLSTTGYSIWNRTGTWELDRRRYPNGVREVNDYAHKKGLKTILWFEPERVWHPGTWLAEKHPEWLLKLKASQWPAGQAVDKNARLLNLGNPAALRWLSNHVSGLLTRERVDIYREDFNMDPLAFWRANDAKNRQGITEIRHVMGHLAFWDELRRRHPNLLIDCVASGSKRIELEAFRRAAMTLTRSDYIPGIGWKTFKETLLRLAANQSMIYGISSWIPYHGNGFEAHQIDAYRFRCFMSLGMGVDFDPRSDDLDEDLWRRLMAQFKQVAPYYFGDYYPLTPYSLESNAWMAWQFDCPEKGEGMVQAFRREQSRLVSLRLKLRGLCPGTYLVTNLDDNRTLRLTGRTLMAEGLPVTLKSRPESGLWIYRRAGQKKT